MNEIQTMDFQRYSEYIDGKSVLEIGKFDDYDIAIEIAYHIEEVPAKFGLDKTAKSEIIRFVIEEPSKWSTTLSIDGFIVLVWK
tara:strand:+ start:1462 stop:1713 length:252 start_codon:yes stop_codon:yes gene_type:complete